MWAMLGMMAAQAVIQQMNQPKQEQEITTYQDESESPWTKMKPVNTQVNKFQDKPNSYYVGQPEKI